MIEEIENAKSIERLKFLAWVIREDTKSGCEWIYSVNLEELREAWKQKNELKRRKSTKSTK